MSPAFRQRQVVAQVAARDRTLSTLCTDNHGQCSASRGSRAMASHGRSGRRRVDSDEIFATKRMVGLRSAFPTMGNILGATYVCAASCLPGQVLPPRPALEIHMTCLASLLAISPNEAPRERPVGELPDERATRTIAEAERTPS